MILFHLLKLLATDTCIFQAVKWSNRRQIFNIVTNYSGNCVPISMVTVQLSFMDFHFSFVIMTVRFSVVG